MCADSCVPGGAGGTLTAAAPGSQAHDASAPEGLAPLSEKARTLLMRKQREAEALLSEAELKAWLVQPPSRAGSSLRLWRALRRL